MFTPRLICSSRCRGGNSPVSTSCIFNIFFGPPHIRGGTANTTLLLAISLWFTVTFAIFLTVKSLRPFVVSESNTNNTNVAAVTHCCCLLLFSRRLVFLPSSSLVTFLCVRSFVRFRMRIENGRRTSGCAPSLLRPSLALLFNFPQDNNPMTTALTTSEGKRRGRDRRKTYDGVGRDVADEYRVNHLSHVELDGSRVPPLQRSHFN